MKSVISVALVKSSVDTKGDEQIVSRLGVSRRSTFYCLLAELATIAAHTSRSEGRRISRLRLRAD